MKLLSLRELKSAKGIPHSRSSIYRLVSIGRFPKPVKLGVGPSARIAFLENEVDAFIAAAANERGGTA